MIEASFLDRLYRQADAGRWSVPPETFRDALESSVQRAFADAPPSRRELDRYLEGLHLADLALACACAEGREAAWDHFVAEHRPVLYRAADALDPSGGGREIADSLYAELYGLRGQREVRTPLFNYFHGRSSLATWLRAILSQRYVDRLRERRRVEPLDEDARETAIAAPSADPEHARFTDLVGAALTVAIAALTPRDRLRLRAYYEQDLTLAQVGRVTGEHEATVSRQIAKTRKTLRQDVERALRQRSRLDDAELARCLAVAMDDAGAIDVRKLFGSERKIPAGDRSE